MFSLKNEKTWVKITLFTIIAVTFIISTYVVLSYNNYFLLGSYEKGDNDDVRYIRSAVTLLDKGILTYHNVNTPTNFIMPGITFVLAAFIKFLGLWSGVSAFRVFQVILQVGGLFLIFLIARQLFNSKVAIVACIIDALYLPEFFTSGLILTEGIFKFLLLLLVLITIHALKTKKVTLYMLGGFILGLTCLFRPTIALYPAVVLIMWIIQKYKFKEIFKFTIITGAVFAIVMSPWWIRNYVTFNKFIPLSEATGNPLLQGTYIGYQARLADPEYLKVNGQGNAKQVELGKRRIKELFEKTPIQAIQWYTIGKTIYYWREAFYWRPVLGVSGNVILNFHRIILYLGIAGIILSFFKRRESTIALVVILYFNAAHLPYLTASRYSFPVMPFMMMYTAYAGVYMIARINEWQKLLRVKMHENTRNTRGRF